MTRVICTMVLCLGLAACGGGGSRSTTPPVNNPPPTGNPPASSPPAPPTTVAAGSTGVDISVPGPSTNPVLNAVALGATGGGGSSAFSTGDFVHRGATAAPVIVFGNGVSGTSTIRIGGPGDVTVVAGSAQSITSTGGTPGVAFTVNVTAGAVLGPRTVFITSGNDMTTFTGGLEVVP